ncbi:MAG: DUF1499 domain-containing protein [Burkholderiales bacterium]
MPALRLLPLLALAAAVAVAASGFGARFGLWDYRMAFQVLRWGAYAGLAIAAVAVIAALVPRARAGNGWRLGAAAAIGVAAAALPLYWLHVARSVPPINDITTDTANPPAFVAILPLRAQSPVPAAYPGEATARAQRDGYPDLKPIVTAKAPPAAFVQALAAARALGWTIVAADEPAGRIEATASTPWFGFTDDVVIRVAADPAGSRVDVRSVSRVGKSDLGANARRIREFAAAFAR